MGPAHEVVEGDWGEMTSNKYFITNKRYILFRVIEIIVISIVAALVPSFSDILGFNILCALIVFDSFIVTWQFFLCSCSIDSPMSNSSHFDEKANDNGEYHR